MTPPPYRPSGNGIVLTVKARPGRPRTLAREVVATVDGSALAVDVAAAPEDGKANAALIAWLAKALGAARADVTILSGESSRQKVLRIDGDPAALTKSIKTLLDKDT